ncbi:hypothetical protein AK812_SmicGene32803 [Symbiodinium microadriaticum]|uniref:Uncharacterized protein n=1 Tax=Symbiodinium microadriaticum TaxID=2951 RepID=A0A1Q9CT60_SYMMI|nr:hypothetical protein AK812_SmicGene32803 [Symbiodinium microadriaticum]
MQEVSDGKGEEKGVNQKQGVLRFCVTLSYPARIRLVMVSDILLDCIEEIDPAAKGQMADAIEERRARDERHGKPGRLCYTCADLSVRQLFAEPGNLGSYTLSIIRTQPGQKEIL